MRRRNNLKKQGFRSLWLSGCVFAVTLLLAACGRAREEVYATATAAYMAVSEQGTRNAAAIYAASTADAQKLETREAEQNAMSTGDAAVSLTRNAETEGELNAQAAQTAQANADAAMAIAAQGAADALALQESQNAIATALALSQNCRDMTLYTYEVGETPILAPQPVPTYVIGDTPPAVSATWVITNTGGCPMQNIQLLFEDAATFAPVLNLVADNARITSLEPEAAANLTIYFSESFRRAPYTYGSPINWEWIILVDNPGNTGTQFDLTLRQHPQLALVVNRWIAAVEPTPTFTPTPTLTPTFTPEPPPTSASPEPTTTPLPPEGL